MERFDKYGQIRVPYKEHIKSEEEYYYESSTHYCKEGNPSMWRSNYKLLGEAVSYLRRGGDIPGPWHDSSFGCPKRGGAGYLQMKILLKIKGKIMGQQDKFFKQVELALAAYANLDLGVLDQPELQKVGFSIIKSSTFASTYRVADQYNDIYRPFRDSI